MHRLVRQIRLYSNKIDGKANIVMRNTGVHYRTTILRPYRNPDLFDGLGSVVWNKTPYALDANHVM